MAPAEMKYEVQKQFVNRAEARHDALNEAFERQKFAATNEMKFMFREPATYCAANVLK